MAHTIGSLPARASSAGNPITFSQAALAGETVMVVMLIIQSANNRAGGALTWGEYTLTGSASNPQKAAATPEAGCEVHYLVGNFPPGTRTLTIPNTGGLTIFYQVAFARAKSGSRSAFDIGAGANATAANPSPGAIVTNEDGDAVFAVVASGAQTWAPTPQAGTVISNNDDGSTGGGTQYTMQSSKGSLTLGWTFGTSDDYGAIVVAFKEAGVPALNNLMFPCSGNGMSVTRERVRL